MERFEEERFFEMANVRQLKTGLPMIVWVDTSKTYIDGGHYKRMKFQLNTANKTQKENFATVSLADCKVVDREEVLNQRNCELSSKDLTEVENFVYNNNFALRWCADELLDDSDLIENLIKGGKLASESEIEETKRKVQNLIKYYLDNGVYDGDKTLIKLVNVALNE